MILSAFYYLLFSALFYFVFRISYSRLSFHRFNRWSLLLMPIMALGIAFIAPLFTFPYPTQELTVLQLPEIVIEGRTLDFETVQSKKLPSSWTLIYFMGIGISAFYFLLGLIRFSRLLSEAQKEEHQHYTIRWSKHLESPFCFGRYILIPETLRGDKDLNTIIDHELHHVRLGHIWDRFYYKLLSTLLWFDPFIHAFARELKQVHEYEVDAELLKENEIEDYAHTLLRSTLGADLAFPEKALAPSPFFNSSLIKSRITMMYSNQSRPWRKALYAFILPISLGMSVFACNKTEAEDPVVVGVENQARALNIEDVDNLPLTGNCDENSTKEERKTCMYQAVYTHIAENFKYPELAEEIGLEGKIFVSFVVETDGKIGDVEVIRGIIAEGADQETAAEQAETQAVALVKSIPSFSASAVKDEVPVRFQMVLPISLKLS